MATTTTKLEVASREPDGSRSARRLRRTGRIPGVLYGGGAGQLQRIGAALRQSFGGQRRQWLSERIAQLRIDKFDCAHEWQRVRLWPSKTIRR